MHPKHSKPQSYILHCSYSWGGENNINLLLKTDIDLARLAKTNLPEFINFVSTSIAPYYDFANYMPDDEICEIDGIERQKDESIEAFTHRFIEEATDEMLLKIQNLSFDISINKSYRSSFHGFTPISEEEAVVLNNHMPSEHVFQYLF